jgi:hypothetical protein
MHAKTNRQDQERWKCRKARGSEAQEVEAATASKGKRNTQGGRNGDASGRKCRGEKIMETVKAPCRRAHQMARAE